ncbi:Uncharacterised protein [uncultured archaeon]|nr:Uncharacterised protein [uncultured archaeon]
MLGNTNNKSKIETKVSYEEFEQFYLEHPGESPQTLSEVFNVSPRCIYYKLRRFNRLHNDKFVDASSLLLQAFRDGRKEGYDEGVLIGLGIGDLLGEFLKSNGIGITDFIAKFSEYVHGTYAKKEQVIANDRTSTA